MIRWPKQWFILFVCMFVCLVDEYRSTACDIGSSVAIEGAEFKGGELTINGTIYKEGEYLIDDDNGIRVCVCNDKICIRKCCPSGQSLANDSCASARNNDNLQLDELPFSSGRNSSNGTDNISTDRYKFLIGFPCDEFYAQNEFVMTSKGLLKEFGDADENIYHDLSEYCIDRDETEDDIVLTSWICFQNENEQSLSPYNYFLLEKCYHFGAICFFIFFVLSFFTYPVLPQAQNVQGSCLIFQSACFFAVHLTIVFGYFFTLEPLEKKINGHIFYFFYFAANFWTMIMSYDMNQSYRYATAAVRIKSNSSNIWNSITYYSILCWGTSLLITCTIYEVDSRLIPEGNHYKIHLGEDSIVIENSGAIILFFYFPVKIIFTITSFLFIETAIKRKIKNYGRTNIIEIKGYANFGNNDEDSRRYTICKNIYIMTAFLWLVELALFYYVCLKKVDYLKKCWWAYPVLMINNVRGLLTFLIVCSAPDERRTDPSADDCHWRNEPQLNDSGKGLIYSRSDSGYQTDGTSKSSTDLSERASYSRSESTEMAEISSIVTLESSQIYPSLSYRSLGLYLMRSDVPPPPRRTHRFFRSDSTMPLCD